METEDLINAVHERTALWDVKDKRYHSRDMQRKMWVQVANIMGYDVIEVKKKWKGLRDVFRREYKRVYHSGGNVSDECISSWPFLKSMMFLVDVIDFNELTWSVKQSSQKQIATSKQDESENDELASSESSIVPDSPNTSIPADPQQCNSKTGKHYPTTTTTQKKRRKKMDDNDSDHCLKIEKVESQLFSESCDTISKGDSDYLFLVSLLPFLKKVPHHRKLAVRNKLQQVFIDEDQFMGPVSPSSSWTIELTPQVSYPSTSL